MKENKSFINALKTASAAANARNSLPILDCFLVVGNAITVTNLEVTIKATFDGDPFVSVCLPTNLVLKGLKHVNGEFEVSINGNMAKFKAGEFEFEVPTSDSNDFPSIELVDAEYQTISNHCINEAIRFVANNELVPILNGVAFISDNEKLTIAATDRYCLYENKTNVYFSGSFVMPPKACLIIKDVSEFDVAFNNKRVSVKYGNVEMIAILLEGKYPNYKSIMPNNQSKLNVDYSSLSNSIERVSEFSNSEQSLVKFNVKQNSVDILGRDLLFATSAKESITLDTAATPIEVWLKANNIITALRTGRGCLMYSRPDTPITVVSENKTILVMPVQING